MADRGRPDVVAADGLAAENHKVLGALHQEPQELLAENHLNLVGLLDADRDPHRVDRRLDQHLLFLVTRDHQRVEQELAARRRKLRGTNEGKKSVSPMVG